MKELREREGLTFAAVGRLVGVHEVSVKGWLAPRGRPYKAIPGPLACAAIESALRRFQRGNRKAPTLRPRAECPACLAKKKRVVVDMLTDSPLLFRCPTCAAVYLPGREGGIVAWKGAAS